MKLREILKEFIPVKEIKTRFENKQIKVNNELITDLNIDLNVMEGYWSLDDFFWANRNSKNFQNLIKISNIFSNFRNYFGGSDMDFLSGFTLISFSKHPYKDSYVFMNLN